MLKHLILKEIQEITTNSRSLFVLLICALIIPFGLIISTKEYEQNKASYKEAKQLYEDQNKDKKDMNFVAEGYIPPSQLSIISKGLADYFPDKITTDNNQQWKLVVDYGIINPIALIFGKIDLYYIVTIILSLLSLMFTFNSIIGEKESGTLKLIVSNSIPRWKIIMAKIIGSYSIFLVAFFLGIILGIVLLTLTTSIPFLTPVFLIPFSVTLVISLLFLFILFNIGLLLSIKTRNSGSAITASLLVWVFLAIIIPKVSPMISQMIYPIESLGVVNKRIQLKSDEIGAEYNKSCSELMNNIIRDHGLNPESFNGFERWGDENVKATLTEYDNKVVAVTQRLIDRVVNEIGAIEKNYLNEQLVQQNICKKISSISPISCYTYLITDITHTGLREIQNLESNARQFTIDSQANYFSYLSKNFKHYHIGQNYYSGFFGENKDVKNADFPTLNAYHYPSLVSSIGSNWIELLLLCFYGLLFFALSVFQFIKYDVR